MKVSNQTGMASSKNKAKYIVKPPFLCDFEPLHYPMDEHINTHGGSPEGQDGDQLPEGEQPVKIRYQLGGVRQIQIFKGIIW